MCSNVNNEKDHDFLDSAYDSKNHKVCHAIWQVKD